MKLWRKASYRYRVKEIFGIAIFLFSTGSVFQMLTIPQPIATEKTEPYKTTNAHQQPKSEKAPGLLIEDFDKIDEQKVLRFQPVVEVDIPTSHQIQLSGLQHLPETFLMKMKEKRKKFEYDMKPGRIVGENGLMATREFQGNTWSGMFMKGAIVFFIQSSSSHSRRRMLQRSTWASIRDIEGWKVEVVFVIGKPTDTKRQREIVLEGKEYGDILQYRGSDQSSDSTLKVLAGIQWACGTFPGDFYYASMTDDTLVNLPVVQDHILSVALPAAPPKNLFVATKVDGSTVTSSQPQTIYCFEKYREMEKSESKTAFARSVDTKVYNASYWPPYCTEGLYVLPVSFVKEVYDESRLANISLPSEMHDVFITGILRRRIDRGDINIQAATIKELGKTPLIRFQILPRSNEAKIAQYQLEEENVFRSKWSEWYESIRYRFHIFTNFENVT